MTAEVLFARACSSKAESTASVIAVAPVPMVGFGTGRTAANDLTAAARPSPFAGTQLGPGDAKK
jgi:hypothetical protein